MKNRIVSFALALLAILSLALGSSLAAPPRYKVAYLINGALGDLSFYDSGQEGIDRIKKELNAETRTIECNYDPVAYPQALQSVVACGADVIFVVSYGFEDLLMQYADMYPEKKWINLDTVVQNK
ncbi:MAG: BMP family ABC transporter substrate-binding protein, partial [Firmicutes bacterium]|nr:BMP family ABC transporter substrate-binding protein [Bacillota bacterium]